MTRKIDLTDVWNRLSQIDDKVGHIQGDLNVMAMLHRHKDREELLQLCKKRLGGHQAQSIWMFCNKPKTQKEIGDYLLIKPNVVRAQLSKLVRGGMLEKSEIADPPTFVQSDISKDIGLEKWVDSNLKNAKTASVK